MDDSDTHSSATAGLDIKS